jgi:serine/threonine protein phosphatase PrpC
MTVSESNNCHPTAWINSNGNTMSHSKYEEHKNHEDWKWVIEKHWSDAMPLYTKEQLARTSFLPVIADEIWDTFEDTDLVEMIDGNRNWSQVAVDAACCFNFKPT